MRIRIALLLALLVFAFPAQAWWEVTATWWVDQNSTKGYWAKGATKDDALSNAKANCKNGRTKSAKYYCDNEPLRTDWVEHKDAPPGSYKKSCKDCEIEGDQILACVMCKPKDERRRLDLKQCASLAVIENCNGDLHCSACPEPAKSTSKTNRGVCDKYGKNCKAENYAPPPASAAKRKWREQRRPL